MIKKILLVILIVGFQHQITSQETKTCDTPADDLALDLNSITKCSVETSKDETSDIASRNSKRVSIQVSSRRRVVRKRDAVSGVSGAKTSHKIASIKEKASLIGSLDLSTEEIVEKVPFNLVEEIPLFKACNKVSISQQQKCFKEEVYKHIKRNFKYPQSAYENSVQGRVFAQFVIDKTGAVTDLHLRGPYKGELLEAEAERIIKKLPKFIPGKHNGKAVKVKYGIPFSFKIPGRKATNVRPASRKQGQTVVLKDNVVNFSTVDEIPNFKECISSKLSSDDCFNVQISEHINKNFIYPTEAVKNNISGKVLVYFVIDKTGHVVNIETKSENNATILESATRSLIEKLPVLIPGKHDGKAANVRHVFPIDFTLDDAE